VDWSNRPPIEHQQAVRKLRLVTGSGDRLGAAGGADLAENVAGVFLDGVECDYEVVGDLPVVPALRDELQDFEFAGGQLFDKSGI
jgi:hypothetical protein